LLLNTSVMEDWTVRLMESWAELDCANPTEGVASANTATASMLKITPDVSLTFISVDDSIRSERLVFTFPLHKEVSLASAHGFQVRTLSYGPMHLWSFVTHIVGETRISIKVTEVTRSRGRQHVSIERLIWALADCTLRDKRSNKALLVVL